MAITYNPGGLVKKYGGVDPNTLTKPAPAPTPAPAPAVAPPPPPPPRRELGPLPELQKTAVDRLVLDRTGVDKQFEANRQRAAQVERSRLQQGQDALARRAAQLGGAPGGAFVKQEQIAMDQSAERLGQSNSEIDAAKDAEFRRMGELETQINEQRAQAQAALDMDKWKTDLNTALNKYGVDVQGDQFDANYKMEQDKLAFTKDQAKIENDINIKNGIITQLQNLKTSGYTPEQIDGILKSLGLENLGISLEGLNGVTKRPPIVQPTSQGFGARAKAIEENRKNGYSMDEIHAAGIS